MYLVVGQVSRKDVTNQRRLQASELAVLSQFSEGTEKLLEVFFLFLLSGEKQVPIKGKISRLFE